MKRIRKKYKSDQNKYKNEFLLHMIARGNYTHLSFWKLQNKRINVLSNGNFNKGMLKQPSSE